MNKIKLDRKNNVAYYDDLIIDNFQIKFFQDNGVLELIGNLRVYEFSYEKIFSADVLKNVDDSYYKKSFWTGKRNFVQGWYLLKERKKIRLTSSCWSITEEL